ncbi:hypothetical protein OSB04_030000 [Centaurea solstitialis]|uniref:Fe2OG dioxygenase domain-containing protein n=1 Tax=Centaurea solstitialis TaxID=347529 RepID=A0AA38SQ95_9ASTR|nr:hypothetical protein OSB04_030000 [Centaurea solstitialis]
MDISQDDRIKQLKAFDDTKSGVKGLIDAAVGGPLVIPKIFIRPPDELAEDLELSGTTLHVPVIDLNGVNDTGSTPREKIVQEVKQASEKWGFFQVVNHGIPIKVLQEMLNGVCEFNEQDVEVKKRYYSRDPNKSVKFNSNYDLYMSRSANWRDTLAIYMLNSYDVDPQLLPSVCRDAIVEYLIHLKKVVDTLFELLSEALGLETNHLKRLECEKGRALVCNYYPACPMPEQTLGMSKHTDASFITVGGLQVLHENQWADVEPIHGALIVNIGDLLQILSNDKFKSVIHRAHGNASQTRTSVACFLDGVVTPPKVYGPIKELITKGSPQMYTEFTVSDYLSKFFSRGLDEKSGLKHRSMDISQDDRIEQLKAFDDTKLGVKGVVDAAVGGPLVIPKIFIRPPDELAEDLELPEQVYKFPEKIVQEVKQAAENWGFFQVVNHGMPIEVLQEMLNGVREFNEQDVEVKKSYYSRDPERKVKFNSNYDLYMSRSANWRDTMIIDMMESYDVDPQHLPSVCRDATIEYLNHLKKAVGTLFELLSEALGLETNYLNRLECGKARTLGCNYYPACPMPDQTLGIGKHTDASFITVLIQDEVGGLQVLHENQWADVEPIHGALTVNIGDLLQILSNDKFRSVIHRALGNASRTRLSVACFLDGVLTPPQVYGPIKELITKESPQMYKEFTVSDYISKFFSRGLDHKSGLDNVRI